MEKRRQIIKKNTKLEIRKKCDEAQEKLINDKCRNRADNVQNHCRNLLQENNAHPQDILYQKAVTSFLKKKILDRWAEYVRELFEDHRKDCHMMKRNFADPPIIKGEIQAAIRKMKSLRQSKRPRQYISGTFKSIRRLRN